MFGTLITTELEAIVEDGEKEEDKLEGKKGEQVIPEVSVKVKPPPEDDMAIVALPYKDGEKEQTADGQKGEGDESDGSETEDDEEEEEGKGENE